VSTWTSDERLLVFFSIYQSLFLGLNITSIDVLALAKSADIIDFKDSKIQSTLAVFAVNQEDYVTQLKSYLRNWTLTYPLVKAVFFTALLEMNQTSDVQTLEHFSEYIRLAQDFTGTESVGLIHAILLKIFEARGLSPKSKAEVKIDSKNESQIETQTEVEIEENTHSKAQPQSNPQSNLQSSQNANQKPESSTELNLISASKIQPKADANPNLQPKS